MSIVAAILATLLGLVLAIVLVPFRARAAGVIHEGEPSGSVRVDWGLGLIGVAFDSRRRVTLRVLWIPVGPFSTEKRERKARPARKGKPGKRERKESERGALGRLRAALAERGALGRMASRIVRALHLRLRASGRLGVGDPADTATLHALLSAARTLPGVELEVELDWVEDVLDLELEAGARIWIAELLAVAIALLLARSNRRALRTAFGWGTT